MLSRLALIITLFAPLALPCLADEETDQIVTLLSESSISFRLGHLEEALFKQGQALDLARAADDAQLYSIALFKSAQTDAALGNEQRAINRFHRCAKLFRRLKNSSGESECFLELGNLYARADRKKQAARYYDQAQFSATDGRSHLKARLNKALLSGEANPRMFGEYLRTNPGPEAELWLGTFFLKTGRLTQAFELLSNARSEFQRRQDNIGFLTASLNLASLQYQLGSTEKTLDTIYQGLDSVPLDSTIPKELEAKLALLMITVLPQGPERANWSKLARERLTGETRTDFILAEIERDIAAGDFDQAERRLTRLQVNETAWGKGRQALAAAQILQGKGEKKRSRSILGELALKAESDKNFTLAWRARVALAELLEATNKAAAITSYEKALSNLEQIRGQLGQDELKTTFLQDKKPVYSSMMALLLEMGEPERAFEISEQARARSLLDSMRRQSLPLGQSGVLSFRQIQTVLPDNVTALSYWMSSDDCIIFELTNQHLNVREATKTPQELESLVKRMRPERWYDARQLPAFDYQAANLLHSTLLPPSLPPGQTLLIIPDGPLHHLSFASLRRQSFLVEDHPIVYGASASISASMQRTDASYQSALVYAAPQTLPAVLEQESLGDLPYSRVEAEAVESTIPDTILRLGKDALESHLYNALATRSDIIHFATHSFVNARDPLLSGLLLERESGSADGILLAVEIARLTLRTRLVVLSSCNSGLGKVTGAEGVVGLVRAFQIAGAPEVVASLWQIDDRSTASLMADFYEGLKNGRSADEALRGAQLQALKSEYQHPYQWAAFVANGTAWVSSEPFSADL